MMKLKNLFVLSWRKLWVAVVGGFVSILLHNAFYAVFGFEEPVFLIIAAFVVPVYIIISVVYSLILWGLRKK